MLDAEKNLFYVKIGELGQTEGVEGVLSIGELSPKPYSQTTAVKGGRSTAYTGDGGFVENLPIKIAGNRNPGLVNQWNMYARDFARIPSNYTIEVVGGKFRSSFDGKLYIANYSLTIDNISLTSMSGMEYNTVANEENNLITYALTGGLLSEPKIIKLA